MGNKAGKMCMLLSMVFLLLISSGCWDRRELDQHAIVSGIGLDTDPVENHIRLSVQIIDPSQVSTAGSDQAGGGKPFWIASTSSDTVFDAIRDMTNISSRPLTLVHNKVLIVGEDLAKEGLQEHLDVFFRDIESRTTNWIFIAEGRAEDILKLETPMMKISSFSLSSMLEVQPWKQSQTILTNYIDFAQAASCPTTAVLLPVVSTLKTETGEQPQLSATAVLDKDLKLIGKLNEQESRGVLWIMDKVRGGILVIHPSATEKASLEIIRSQSKVKMALKNNMPEITIEVDITSNLSELSGNGDLMSPAIWNKLAHYQAKAVEKEIRMAVEKAQELNADVFGFGAMIYKKYPQEWKTIEALWDDIFPLIEVNVQVKSRVKHPGFMTRSFSQYQTKG